MYSQCVTNTLKFPAVTITDCLLCDTFTDREDELIITGDAEEQRDDAQK
jgi:hypothetical protein